MKKGWQVKKLGDIATVSAGNSAPQDKGLFHNGTHPFIRTSDVGKIRFGSIKGSTDYLNEKGIKKLRLFEEGTILFPKSGASTFLNHRVIMEVDGYVASHLATITAVDGAAEPRFLLYCLSTVQAQDLIQDHKYPSLNLPIIKSIQIPIPSLKEQKRIVALLDEAFEGIATAKATAEKNLQNARDLFDSHLNSVFSQKGDGWVDTTIGELCKLKSGSTVSPAFERPIGDIAYLKVADMTVDGNESAITTSSRFLNEADIKKSAIIPEGATIFPKRGGSILTNKKRITSVPICADLNIMAVIPSAEIDAHLLYAYFLNVDMKKLGTGSSIPQINNYDIAPLPISFPKAIGEQREIAECFQSLRAETQRLEEIYQQKVDALDELKAALLNRAFNGEL